MAPRSLPFWTRRAPSLRWPSFGSFFFFLDWAEMLLLLLPLGGSLESGRAPPACPSVPCFCFTTPDTVQCRFLRLQAPPTDSLPTAVHNLSILGGNLSVLPGAAFAGGFGPGGRPNRPLANLTLLVLTHDGVEALEEGAFAGLPSLATLDLSHNPLRTVSGSAFASCGRLRTLRLNAALLGAPRGAAEALLDGALGNLSSLARLELRGNRLRDPPPFWALPLGLEEVDLRNNSIRAWKAERLDGLLALPRLRLQVAPNPLECDCPSLRPLLAWHRNATWRTPDARNLRCASPARLKETPLRRLRPFQLGCLEEEDAEDWGLLEPDPSGPEDPELETASYVFFGIVLALIGVVFLMVLYLNRRGIKRWLNNLREACRDQMEGYHYRYEQDSDPRRAHPGDL